MPQSICARLVLLCSNTLFVQMLAFLLLYSTIVAGLTCDGHKCSNENEFCVQNGAGAGTKLCEGDSPYELGYCKSEVEYSCYEHEWSVGSFVRQCCCLGDRCLAGKHIRDYSQECINNRIKRHCPAHANEQPSCYTDSRHVYQGNEMVWCSKPEGSSVVCNADGKSSCVHLLRLVAKHQGPKTRYQLTSRGRQCCCGQNSDCATERVRTVTCYSHTHEKVLCNPDEICHRIEDRAFVFFGCRKISNIADFVDEQYRVISGESEADRMFVVDIQKGHQFKAIYCQTDLCNSRQALEKAILPTLTDTQPQTESPTTVVKHTTKVPLYSTTTASTTSTTTTPSTKTTTPKTTTSHATLPNKLDTISNKNMPTTNSFSTKEPHETTTKTRDETSSPAKESTQGTKSVDYDSSSTTVREIQSNTQAARKEPDISLSSITDSQQTTKNRTPTNMKTTSDVRGEDVGANHDAAQSKVSSGSGLSAGAAAGIVVLILLVALLVAGGVIFMVKRRKAKRALDEENAKGREIDIAFSNALKEAQEAKKHEPIEGAPASKTEQVPTESVVQTETQGEAEDMSKPSAVNSAN